MRRLRPVLLALLLCLGPTGLPAARAAVPTGFEVFSNGQLADGVEFATMGRDDPAAVGYVARVAPGAPVTLMGVNSHDRIPHDGESLETPSSMCRRVGCIAGINGDFHNTSTHEPLGGVVSGGRMLRSPVPTHLQLILTRDGRMSAGPLPWSAALRTSDGAGLGLDGINTSRPEDGLVLYTSAWGTRTQTSGGAELVLRAAEPLGTLGRPVPVDVVELDGGDSAIPADGAVLSGAGEAATVLEKLWEGVRTGTVTRRAELRVDSPVDAVESLGANPRILADGRPAYPPADDGFTLSHHPRTLLGWNAAGDVFLVAVDGRTDQSRGLTLAEAADLLLGLGATDGVNFDGGGGTTFVVDGSVVNHPVPNGEVDEERGSTNGLMLVPRDSAALPPGGVWSPVQVRSAPAPPPRSGYWMVAADGGVFAFGDARYLGGAVGLLGSVEAVDLEPTPSYGGYWIVDAAGRVYAYGDARYLGNADVARLAPGEAVTSLSATRSGAGYWIFTSRGRALPFGDARFHGDMTGVALNGPVLDSIPSPSGRGYYMVAADGGIFAFGDARFAGSMGGRPLNAPVQSLVPDPDGRGYWLVASDGGVFSFDAPFRGSMGDKRLNRPVTGMVPYGNGYLMVAIDGGIFNFSNRAFAGSLGEHPPVRPVVAVSALDP